MKGEQWAECTGMKTFDRFGAKVDDKGRHEEAEAFKGQQVSPKNDNASEPSGAVHEADNYLRK